MAAVQQNQLNCYYTGCQQNRKRRTKGVEVEIGSADSFCLTSQSLVHGGSPDTFVNTMVCTQKEDSAVVVHAYFFASPFLRVTM